MIASIPSARWRASLTVAACEVASLQTREFNFHEAFLKLTGTEFK